MNMKYIGWTFALLGQVLIALGFFYIFDVTALVGENVCWLDFVTVSIVCWIWFATILHSPIDINEPSGKEAAGLGIRWGALSLYSVLSLGVVAAGLATADDPGAFKFKTQLLIQICLLFFYLLSVYFSVSANRHAGDVSRQEENIKEGKASIRIEMQDLVDKAERTAGVPDEVKSRLRTMNNDIRYLTPSASAEARRVDDRIIEDIRTLEYSLSDYMMNRERISETIDALEHDFRCRKSVF